MVHTVQMVVQMVQIGAQWCNIGALFLNNSAPNCTLMQIVGAGLFNYTYQYVKYLDGPFQWLRHAFESGGGP